MKEQTDFSDIFFIEKELKEFYTKNAQGKCSGFGRRLIMLYARLNGAFDHKFNKSK